MKYTEAMVEIIDLKVEDVVLQSGGGCNPVHCPVDSGRF